MPMPRLDPVTPGDGPILSATVTTSVRDRVVRIAAARGVPRSVVIRELLDSALQALELEAAG